MLAMKSIRYREVAKFQFGSPVRTRTSYPSGRMPGNSATCRTAAAARLSGPGTLYIGAGTPQRFRVNVGDLVRIPPHTFHRIRCSGKEKLVYLSVDCFPGGGPKDEPVRVMCALNGWDFDKVRK